ncbi:hypothetical protein B0H16DRAFT_1627187 [Mycena metata]|uniref:Uncharacterized protein n=1 Tax=Mycena metata TaxID=1033252 RepID=A0AAD7H450_9AGAR|nr:hypothetical protein B0H16DRAFT_1627187 [Mycena metata]
MCDVERFKRWHRQADGLHTLLPLPTMLLVASLLVAGLAIQAVRAQATIYRVSQYGPQDTDLIFKETTSFSVAGVGPSGVTTYIEEVVESYEAIVDVISATTHTFVILDSPTTLPDFVFVESSGGFSASAILSTISYPEIVTDMSFDCTTGVDSKPTCTSSATLATISFPETFTDISFDCTTGVDSKPTCTSSTILDTVSTPAPEVIVCQFNADEEGNCTDLLPDFRGASDEVFSFSGSVVPIYTLAATASTPANTNHSGAGVHVARMWWNGMFAVLAVLVNLLL